MAFFFPIAGTVFETGHWKVTPINFFSLDNGAKKCELKGSYSASLRDLFRGFTT